MISHVIMLKSEGLIRGSMGELRLLLQGGEDIDVPCQITILMGEGVKQSGSIIWKKVKISRKQMDLLLRHSLRHADNEPFSITVSPDVFIMREDAIEGAERTEKHREAE